MDKRTALRLIQQVSEAPGASGFEDDVVAALRPYAERFGRATEDSLRNLYVDRLGNAPGRPTVLLDAHTDEVSFMVQAVKPDGTLRFMPLGRWVEAGVAAHRVRVRNALGEYIPGVVASTPPHHMSEAQRAAPPSLEAMSIDIGACSADEARDVFRIRIGEPVVPDVRFAYDERHDLMIGKAFDCRLGCAAIAAALDLLSGETLPVNVVGAWACQEEVGTRGALVTANRVRPDIAIVFEGCPADDTVVEPYRVQTALKRGPMLRYIDARMITHPRFQRFTLALAERLGIPAQTSVRSGGSTDGAPIHLSCLGVPCIVIGLPVRYIHTPNGIASFADFEQSARLGAEVVKALTPEIIKGF